MISCEEFIQAVFNQLTRAERAESRVKELEAEIKKLKEPKAETPDATGQS